MVGFSYFRNAQFDGAIESRLIAEAFQVVANALFLACAFRPPRAAAWQCRLMHASFPPSGHANSGMARKTCPAMLIPRRRRDYHNLRLIFAQRAGSLPT